MAIRIKPANADPETYLRILYQKTETDIINEIFRKRNQGYVDYAEVAALERIQNDLQGMVTESFKYVPKLIEKRFYGDDNPGYGNADAVRGTTNRFMMEMLADNLMGEITETAERAFETSKKLYTLARLDDDVFREAALTSTLYTEALGKGAAISAKFLEATVRSKGVTGFVDKAGRHWSLYAYCNMATRTTARQAEVAGVLSNDEEQDLYRIIPHTSSCAICAPLQGRVYSKSGTNPNYPPLSLAFGKIDPNGGDDLTNTYLNIHPNCLCALVPWTEEGKTEKEIEKARKFSSPEKNPLSKDPRSQKEIEAYRTKEKNRRKKLAELRAKYGREAGRNLPKPLNIPKPPIAPPTGIPAEVAQKVTEKVKPPKPPKFEEKIAAIREEIEKNGGDITEANIKEAGGALRTEYEKKIKANKSAFERAQKKYNDFLDKLDEFNARGLEILRRGNPDEIKAYNAEKYVFINSKEFDDAEKRYEEASKAYFDFNGEKAAKWLKGKLSEIREMGIDSKLIEGHLSGSEYTMRPVVAKTYQYFPRKWVAKSIEYGALTVSEESRGYYDNVNEIIALSGTGVSDARSFSNAVHELGHRFEYSVYGIRDAETAFYNRRTEGESPEWLGAGYDKWEVTRKDNFIHPYMGKDYDGRAYELVSMGFQYAYTDPEKLATDPDMQEWIYGLLCLK